MHIEIDSETAQRLIIENNSIKYENIRLIDRLNMKEEEIRMLREEIEMLKDLLKGTKENEYR